MDNNTQSISSQPDVPSSNQESKPRKKLLESNALLYTILVIVLIGAIGLDGWAYATRHKKVSTVATTSTSKTTTSPKSTSTPSLTTATDDQSLTTDLNTINSSLNQSAQDSASANGAVNDRSQAITVPTS